MTTDKADFYTWNDKKSGERLTIERFLSDAQERIECHANVPFAKDQGTNTIAWLRQLLSLKPSEMRDTDG